LVLIDCIILIMYFKQIYIYYTCDLGSNNFFLFNTPFCILFYKKKKIVCCIMENGLHVYVDTPVFLYFQHIFIKSLGINVMWG